MTESAILSSILMSTIILISLILPVLLEEVYVHKFHIAMKVSKVNLASYVTNTGSAGIKCKCRGLRLPRPGINESQKV